MQDSDSERIADLERRVDYLIRYLGIDPAQITGGAMPSGLEVAPRDEVSGGALGPVYDALRRGRKIEAIKQYRKLTGASLAESKRAVDAMARGLLHGNRRPRRLGAV